MKVDIKTIKSLTRRLANIQLKRYGSLSEIKDDFDSVASTFIDLDSEDDEVLDRLKNASAYFNLLSEDDFKTNDSQKTSEARAVISSFTKELNKLLGKWRKELGHF